MLPSLLSHFFPLKFVSFPRTCLPSDLTQEGFSCGSLCDLPSGQQLGVQWKNPGINPVLIAIARSLSSVLAQIQILCCLRNWALAAFPQNSVGKWLHPIVLLSPFIWAFKEASWTRVRALRGMCQSMIKCGKLLLPPDTFKCHTFTVWQLCLASLSLHAPFWLNQHV